MLGRRSAAKNWAPLLLLAVLFFVIIALQFMHPAVFPCLLIKSVVSSCAVHATNVRKLSPVNIVNISVTTAYFQMLCLKKWQTEVSTHVVVEKKPRKTPEQLELKRFWPYKQQHHVFRFLQQIKRATTSCLWKLRFRYINTMLAISHVRSDGLTSQLPNSGAACRRAFVC
jgi:ribosomal protein L33